MVILLNILLFHCIKIYSAVTIVLLLNDFLCQRNKSVTGENRIGEISSNRTSPGMHAEIKKQSMLHM